MATFIADIRQFPDAAALAAYLATLPAPNWPGDAPAPIGSTTHNTYIPTIAQWRGLASMNSMIATYKAKKPVAWDRGPHFYLCLGAPNPAHDGIWMMTPPTVPGIHAGACNGDRFGIELVGDYDKAAPAAVLQALLIDVLTVLHTWAKIGPNLKDHRECMPGRTCPGQAMHDIMPALRSRLAARLSPPPPPTDPFAAWGPIDKPEGQARLFGVPQTWLRNQGTLGACIRGERYDLPDLVSRAYFLGGEIRYFAPTGAIEVFTYPQRLPAGAAQRMADQEE